MTAPADRQRWFRGHADRNWRVGFVTGYVSGFAGLALGAAIVWWAR